MKCLQPMSSRPNQSGQSQRQPLGRWWPVCEMSKSSHLQPTSSRPNQSGQSQRQPLGRWWPVCEMSPTNEQQAKPEWTESKAAIRQMVACV